MTDPVAKALEMVADAFEKNTVEMGGAYTGMGMPLVIRSVDPVGVCKSLRESARSAGAAKCFECGAPLTLGKSPMGPFCKACNPDIAERVITDCVDSDTVECRFSACQVLNRCQKKPTPETAPGPAVPERADDGRTETIADGLGGNDRANIKGNEAMSESTPSSAPSVELQCLDFERCKAALKCLRHDITSGKEGWCSIPDAPAPSPGMDALDLVALLRRQRTYSLVYRHAVVVTGDQSTAHEIASRAAADHILETPAAPPAPSVEHPLDEIIRQMVNEARDCLLRAYATGHDGERFLYQRASEYLRGKADQLTALTSRPAGQGGEDAERVAVDAALGEIFSDVAKAREDALHSPLVGGEIIRMTLGVRAALAALSRLHSPAPVEGN